MQRRYGWIRDVHDSRDLKFAVSAVVGKILPKSISLRPICPPILDQGQLGSCTANATASAFRFCEQKERLLPIEDRSRLFIYYNTRSLEGHVDQDSGCQIRNAIKTVGTIGACDEKLWPYDISKFTLAPPKECYDNADKCKAIKYMRITEGDLKSMKQCLADGYPFVFGFLVFSNFDSNNSIKTGIISMPGSKDKIVAGHAVLAIGYDDRTQLIQFQNSWADWWGDKGCGYLPYAYIQNSQWVSDLWTIRFITDGSVPKVTNELEVKEEKESAIEILTKLQQTANESIDKVVAQLEQLKNILS
jgi:C1A family cysteine protease